VVDVAVVDMAEAVVAEGGAEASMVEVDTPVVIVAGTPEDSMVDTLAVVIEVGTLGDSAVGILAGDPVFLLYLEEPMERMLLLYPEDTLVDPEVGITEGIMEDTMAAM
jgi:hypothetical protein